MIASIDNLKRNGITPNISRTASLAIVLTLLASAGIIVAIILYNILVFHVVRTDPSMGEFPTSTPVLIVNFNKPLAQPNPTVSWAPYVSSIVSVKDKQMIIELRTDLQAGQQYTLTINNIASTSGKRIPSKVFTFTAQDIPYNQLSTAIQQEIIKHQDQAPYSRNTIVFIGTDALLNQGVSASQIDAMKQAIFLYGETLKTTISQVVINTASVQAAPRDPESASPYFDITFGITINGTSYKATLSYTNITAARLLLQNPSTNAQVYDSGVIDDSQLN